MKRWCVCLTLLALAVLSLTPYASLPGLRTVAVGQEKQADDEQAADATERRIIERFLGVLEKNPRKGTALDRVYGYHIERGTLEKFLQGYRERTKKDPKDGTAWMILGLVEAQRGRDAAAVAALKQAEAARPTDALASYYLGQALVMVGQPDAAADAFERCIQRKPTRADLLEAFQALGRVHQRAQRTEQALAVWGRLEKLFPDDVRVQEQIASTLSEEGQHEQALKRYEVLIRKTKDNYRQALFRMEAAELKVRLGQAQKAVTDLEDLFGNLNPDSWLYRDVRRKIEEVFLRNDDQAGLAKYYEGWLAKNAEDVDAMARLARTLSTQGRTPEAQTWLEKALKLAPSRKELRLTLIEQLVYEQKFPAALAQYEALHKSDPSNPDTIREWGKTILKDTTRPVAERKKAAAEVWGKLTAAKPKDPVIVSQVADLFRQAEMVDEAIAGYKKAIELAPDAPQYREYLGEYYHSLKRSEEALATWRPIAAGANRSAKNLGRLAEVFSGFGYLKEAVEAMSEAVGLAADDFTLQLKYSELLYQSERYPDALKQLAVADKLASNDEEAEAVLQQQIKCFQGGETLEQETTTLQKELDAGRNATAKRWHRLARYYEAARLLPEATLAIKKTLALDEKWVPGWAAAARIYEAEGNLLAAADANRKLAAIDRRYRTEYLTNVAKLEARLGRRDQALAAGRDLLASAPGNPETYKFYADLCFQLDESDEGLDALRRSVRVNPSEPGVLVTLANALAERFRTDEAIELFWRAFEKSSELEARINVVARLAELYLQANHFEKLLERLERERRESSDKQREMTICLAQAYHSAGDYGTARQQLERLLTENTRDSQLLTQLSSLAESDGDVGAAVKYQRQLLKAAPTKEAEARLAMLLVRSGENEEARAIWVRQTTGEQDAARVLQAIDSLMTHNQPEAAQAVLERILRDHPHDWEALYRHGAALMRAGKRAEAVRRFKTLLDLRLKDDEESALVKARKKEKPGRLAGTTGRRQQVVQKSMPLQERTANLWQLRAAVGLDPDNYYWMQQQGQNWLPNDFGGARLAALGFLLADAQKEGKQDAFLKERKQASEKPGADTRARWDWYYLAVVRQEARETFEASKLLAKGPDPAGQWLYLSNLGSRMLGRGPRVSRRTRTGEVDNTPPLPDDELNGVLAAYHAVRKQRPDWLDATVLGNVSTELKRAKRLKDEQQIYRQAVDAANQADAVFSILGLAAERGDMDSLLKLFGKLEQLQGDKPSPTSPATTRNTGNNLAQAMSVRAAAKALGDVNVLLDRYLAARRRQKKAAPPTAAGRSSAMYSNPNYYGNQYAIWAGTSSRRIQVDYPPPNEYYDYSAIQLLRQAFEVYRRADLVTDLLAHFREQLPRTPQSDRVWLHLGMCYLHWWNEDQDEAVKELARAGDAVPGDTSLRFELAALHEKQNDPEEALAVVEAITPLDHGTMQKKENAALRLAVRTGNVERARQAADRLFGLRLDAETQVTLAGQMRQLGMHNHAEAVLNRARRQAGNRTRALVSLLLQYQQQGKMDLAAQVAHQILRKSGGVSAVASASMRQQGGDPNEGREQAIQVLARSGRLKELVERVETQLKNSPKSMQLHQTLADYYRAAGERAKVKEVYERMAALKPDDAKLRYQVGQYLVQAGEPKAAIDHFLAALKKEPTLYAQDYWQMQQWFQQAGRADDLAQFMEDMDIRQLGNYWSVMQFVQQLLQDEKSTARGLRLFRKAWQAFPQQRQELISSLYRDELWRLPEIYEYVRQAVIPANDAQIDSWSGADHIYSWSGDGKVTGVVNRLLDGAARQNKTEQLTKEVEAALKKYPEWCGGKAVLALLYVRAGKIDEGKKLLQGLLDDKKNPIPMQARWVIGQELENYSALAPIALTLYEGSLKEAEVEQSGIDFSYSPIKRLVSLYQKAGRGEEARALCLRVAGADNNDDYYWDPGYGSYRKINELNSIGEQLLQLGYAIDAVKIYNGVLSDQNRLATASRWSGEWMKQQAQNGLGRALQGLKPDTLARAVRELLTPKADPKAAGAALDLLVLVQHRELNRAALASMLATTLHAAAGRSELQGEVKAKLAALVESRPRDLSVQIAAALAALDEDKPEQTARPALERLAKLVEETPLEPLPEGTRANARQRDAALPHVALWLVARECQKYPGLRAVGDRLGRRALEAADRQADSIYKLAILREWGQTALVRGDRTGAESRWGQMLDQVLTNPHARKKARAGDPATPAPAPVAPPPAAVPPATKGPEPAPEEEEDPPTPPQSPPVPAPAKGAAAKAAVVPVVTTEQFGQAVEIARLAADHGMTALSLRAVRDALRGGPPIQVVVNDGRRTYVGGSPQQGDGANVFMQVEERLLGLVQQWKRRNFPAAEVYAVLAGAVLPEVRPAEVFLYPRPLVHGGVQQPRSVGRLLAQAAVQAGKADDLHQRVMARQALPLAELPGKVLLGVLGLERKDAKAATEQIAWFGARIQKDGLQHTAELACHVALPALYDPALTRAALPVVERVIKNLSTQSGEEPVGSLVLALARFHFGRKDAAEARKQVHEYLRIVEQMNVRYGGDYGLYRRKQQLHAGALEFAKAGQLADALDLLGQATDIPQYRWGEVSAGSLIASVSRQLGALPAAERYATLKAWTLPAANRKAVRLVGSFVPEGTPPAAFGKFEVAATQDVPGVTSTPMMLIETARGLGKLDELAAALEQAAAQKADNADALLILVQIARGQGAKVEPEIRKLLGELAKKRQPSNDRYNRGNVKPVEWSDYLVARACLTDRGLVRLGERMVDELLGQAQVTQNHVFLTHLRRDVANAAVAREGGAPLAAGQDPGLAYWHPASHVSPGTNQQGAVPSWWVGQDDMLCHVTGPEQDLLYFVYPLTGTFEFSADAYVGSWSEAVAAYNGLVFEPFWTGRNDATVWGVGTNDQVARPNRFQKGETFNRITIQVQPGKVRYLANGHLLYEDTDPSPTSPWLALFTRRERHTVWQNVRITGTPQVPREVALCQGDRLEGWVTSFYGESKMPRLSLKQPAPDGQPAPPPPNPEDFDWAAQDGVLRARRADGLPTLDPVQSRLYYHRPLRDGETVRYEFLYEPDATLVHPALDRLAFLLEPDGVRLHWMTDGDNEWTGLKVDNVAEEPPCRRGPSRLPLKPGEWNAVKLTLAGPEVVLELNGVEVYRRPLEPTNGRLFGFFRYKDRTAAQVRNVVLTGNWPTSLTAEQLAHLTARADGKDAPAERTSRVAIIGESFYSTAVPAVLKQARALPAAERYAYLLNWVVPNGEHKTFRLYGDFTPADLLSPQTPPPAAGSRLHSGGTLEAPALELVAVAKEVGKLDELAEKVQAVKPADDPARRGQLALLACVRIAQGRDDNATAALRQLQPLLAKVGGDAPARERWPELVAAEHGLARPATRGAAQALLEHIVVKQIQPMAWERQQKLGALWIQHVRHARAHGQVLAKTPEATFGQDPQLAHWRPVIQTTSATRGNGWPVAHFALQNGALMHYPGHHHDYAYFAVPLRGDFEVSCELTSFGWREAQLGYGGRYFSLIYELKRYDVFQFGRKVFDGIIQPPLTKVGDWYQYKLVVSKGQMTSYVNGRKVHEDPAPADRDPWLVLHVGDFLTGGLRNLRITGQPTIPEQLELSKLPDLTCWLADYYEESVQGDNAGWEKRGEEIYGRSYADVPGSKQESVLRYHRPLLEDGSIEYEFYYLPGKALTHPALDRLAFLLQPEGVQVHWLTDGKYERTGLAPDNAATEKAHRRGPERLPLKERDWNRLKVSLAGDTVTLALNGVVMYERPLEASNQRVFGLFHYADETEVRVRNVVYRGNWPKQLPPPGEILAAPAVSARRP